MNEFFDYDHNHDHDYDYDVAVAVGMEWSGRNVDNVCVCYIITSFCWLRGDGYPSLLYSSILSSPASSR